MILNSVGAQTTWEPAAALPAPAELGSRLHGGVSWLPRPGWEEKPLCEADSSEALTGRRTPAPFLVAALGETAPGPCL